MPLGAYSLAPNGRYCKQFFQLSALHEQTVAILLPNDSAFFGEYRLINLQQCVNDLTTVVKDRFVWIKLSFGED
jgi:hypothetical protein